MASSYPSGFDAMSDPATNLSGPPTHATMHNQINDAIEAVQAELGLSPSGVAATVAARFTALEAIVTASPRGTVAAPAIINTSQSTVLTTYVDVTSVTWTAVTGRRYKITASFNLSATPNGGYVALTDGGNTLLAESDVLGSVNAMLIAHVTGASGTVTAKIRAKVRTSGTLTMNPGGTSGTPTLLIVEDIGV